MINNKFLTDEIEVLYEDENILAINKPAGLIVHSDGRTEEPSVADWVIKNYPSLLDVGEPWVSPQGETILRPGIVHRLDRLTSGVLVIVKTKESHTFVKSQFQNREVEKKYHSFVYGHPKDEKGIIDAEIGRTKKIPRRWTALPGKTGNLRNAVTLWKVLKRGVDSSGGEKVSFLEAMPKTGRTHQIRVHFKFINHPVVCDKIYAPKKDCLLGLGRLALHAFQIKIKTPEGNFIKIEAPYPEDFQRALKIFDV